MLEAKLNHGRDEEDPSGQEVGDDYDEPAWPAPTADEPVDATVHVPGSKSLTGRELVLSALADGPGELRNALQSRDSHLMIEALRELGTEVEESVGSPNPRLRVTPAEALSRSTTTPFPPP